jgi:hypothetical protein
LKISPLLGPTGRKPTGQPQWLRTRVILVQPSRDA